MKKKIILKLLVSLGLSFLLAILFFLISGSRIYRLLEFKTLDLRFILRGNKIGRAPVVLIDIDDASLDKLGRWPWPRVYHANLVDVLAECGAKQILMDVIFIEKQRETPEMDELFSESMRRANRVYLPFYFNEDEIPPHPELKSLLIKDISISPEDAAGALGIETETIKDTFPQAKRYVIDEAVKGVISNNPEILEEELLNILEDSLGWFLFPAEESYIRESFKEQKAARFYVTKFAITNHDLAQGEWPYIKTYRRLTPPIREYLDNLKGSGFINADPALDGVMRRVPLFIKYEDKVLPQLSVAALLDLLRVKNVEFKRGAIVFKEAYIHAKPQDFVIPVNQEGAMLINWQGRWGYSFKHIPYYLVLRLQQIRQQLAEQLKAAELSSREGLSKSKGETEYLKNAEAELKNKLTDMVKDRICIVGLTATGTQDMGPIPLQNSYPLVGTHANLIDTILNENFIKECSAGLNISIFFLTALVIGLSSLIKLWKSLLLSASYAAGYFLVAFLAFDKLGLWIDLVGPGGIVFFGFSAITSFRYFTEEKEKLWVKQAFSHYLSTEVINEMMDDPSKLKLGGERRNISVLFSDIRGFTTFSESHQPEEVVAMLNEVLTEQVKVVFKHSGTLDKFVGDELMAFFGAPGNRHINDHALVCVRTAVEIQAKLKELREIWVQEKKEPLQIGIGINTGDMVVGNMGSLERMDYTVIGDNVNLGARLCSAAKGGEIIISEATYQAARDYIEAEKLEPISVKGKVAPISIYRVIGIK